MGRGTRFGWERSNKRDTMAVDIITETNKRRLAMNLKMLLALPIAAFAGAIVAAPPDSAAPAASEGLIAALSRMNLDEVYVRPNADLSAYRKVIIDPGQAALVKNWLKDINSQRDVSRWLYPSDAQQITDEAAASLAPAVAEVFKSRGYEIASAPGPGVLRLSPSVTDLYVNAPYKPTPGIQRANVRDAGQATLRLDVRDSVTGTLLARVVDRSTAQEIRAPATAAGQLVSNPADSVTNQFWFDALFRQWAGYCAKALESARAG
jgi:hypothetical protein